jgi:nicotinamidase-related amidase
MDISIPHPERRRALVVVDMQPGFLEEHARWIIPNVQKLLRSGGYSLVVEARFYTKPGSLWQRQLDWDFPLEETVQEIKELIPAGSLSIIKDTKSAFKGDKDLVKHLRDSAIEEVHVVGLDSYDCVLATAEESFDLGFYTYVIEEGVESSEGEGLRDASLKILREVHMTNHSVEK